MIPLALVVFVAFLVESAVGFGSALVALSLGAQLLSLREFFPVFQPLSLLLSLLLVLRERHHVQTSFLLRQVLPPMIPGVACGMALFRLGPADALLLLVGIAVVVLASFELRRTLRGQEAAQLPPIVARSALLGAGILHGLFGTSGPLVVWVASRSLPDKATFRATLALLWLLLSLVLTAGFVHDGLVDKNTLRQSAWLLVALLAGFFVGNLIHNAVPQREFRFGVCVLLVLAGTMLVVRAAGALLP
jgi:uncharacterized membrane protein YfcA